MSRQHLESVSTESQRYLRFSCHGSIMRCHHILHHVFHESVLHLMLQLNLGGPLVKCLITFPLILMKLGELVICWSVSNLLHQNCDQTLMFSPLLHSLGYGLVTGLLVAWEWLVWTNMQVFFGSWLICAPDISSWRMGFCHNCFFCPKVQISSSKFQIWNQLVKVEMLVTCQCMSPQCWKFWLKISQCHHITNIVTWSVVGSFVDWCVSAKLPSHIHNPWVITPMKIMIIFKEKKILTHTIPFCLFLAKILPLLQDFLWTLSFHVHKNQPTCLLTSCQHYMSYHLAWSIRQN